MSLRLPANGEKTLPRSGSGKCCLCRQRERFSRFGRRSERDYQTRSEPVQVNFPGSASKSVRLMRVSPEICRFSRRRLSLLYCVRDTWSPTYPLLRFSAMNVETLRHVPLFESLDEASRGIVRAARNPRLHSAQSCSTQVTKATRCI